MKIAFVDQPIGYINPGKASGSINIIVYEIARRLARCADVIVYGRRGPDQVPEQVVDGTRYKRIDTRWDDRIDRRLNRSFRFRKPASPWFLSRNYYRFYIRQIAADIRREKCDVIHLYNFSQFAGVLRAQNPSAKIILNMQCEWLISLDEKAIERHLQSVDCIIGCSEFIANGVRNRFPHLAGRCVAVPNGADPTQFSTSPQTPRSDGPKTILYTGRISPEKGLHVLIDAFVRIANKQPDAQLHLIGPEWIVKLAEDPMMRALAPMRVGYLDFLKERVPEELRDRVRFLGLMSHSEMREHYARAWVAVHPSVCNEAFGMPVAEAMMSGLPVVVSAAGGMPEIVVNGSTGFAVPRNDAEALAGALLTLLENPELRDQMGQAGKKRSLELFNWELIAVRMLREYRKLLRAPENRQLLAPADAVSRAV